MAKVKKSFVTPKWVEIKEMYEKGTNGSDKYGTNFEIKGELDIISSEFVDILGELTRQFGWGCVIEDIKMDLWKERIWSLIENAGLLPEIAWKDATYVKDGTSTSSPCPISKAAIDSCNADVAVFTQTTLIGVSR